MRKFTTTALPIFPIMASMWIILTSLLAVCTAESTVQAEDKVVTLPAASSDTLPTHAGLACFITPDGSSSRWITPDGVSVLMIRRQEHYIVSEGSLAIITGEMVYGSILIVQDLSYKNAGLYLCEALDEEDCSDFPKFATVELVLKMTLMAMNSNVTVKLNDSVGQSVELVCEASGYIRPDSDIRWYRENEAILEGSKYSVRFRDGRPNAAQTGQNETSHSRVSVLTISDVGRADASTSYSCQSLETGEVARLTLSVEYDPIRDSTSITVPVSTTSQPSTLPSVTPKLSMDNTSTDCSASIAASILATFVLTAIIVAATTIIIFYLWYKSQHGRRIKSGISSPDLGSTAHATSHTNVSEQIDMYRISTVDREDMEDSSGDSRENAATTTQ